MGRPADAPISRAKRAGLIEAAMRWFARSAMSQFPAQNARASLKHRRRGGGLAGGGEFPAQNARASLKRGCGRRAGPRPRQFPAQNARASLKHRSLGGAMTTQYNFPRKTRGPH